jgi:hypothetical protein
VPAFATAPRRIAVAWRLAAGQCRYTGAVVPVLVEEALQGLADDLAERAPEAGRDEP